MAAILNPIISPLWTYYKLNVLTNIPVAVPTIYGTTLGIVMYGTPLIMSVVGFTIYEIFKNRPPAPEPPTPPPPADYSTYYLIVFAAIVVALSSGAGAWLAVGRKLAIP